MKCFTARQGDVMIRQVASLPKGVKKVENKDRIVLAYGEVTGHAHAIAEREATEFTMEQAGGAVKRFLQVVSEATLRHEEHAPIEIPAGIFEIVQQKEYSPEAIKNVAD